MKMKHKLLPENKESEKGTWLTGFDQRLYLLPLAGLSLAAYVLAVQLPLLKG
jgi:hypothetical protein